MKDVVRCLLLVLLKKNPSPIFTSMNTVVAPADFSEVSKNALLFSAELRKKASAPLVVANFLQASEDEEKTTKKLSDLEPSLKKSFGSPLPPLVLHDTKM